MDCLCQSAWPSGDITWSLTWSPFTTPVSTQIYSHFNVEWCLPKKVLTLNSAGHVYCVCSFCQLVCQVEWCTPTSGVSRFFFWLPGPPLDHDFFNQGGDTVTGTDRDRPLTFATFGNPLQTNSGYATANTHMNMTLCSVKYKLCRLFVLAHWLDCFCW